MTPEIPPDSATNRHAHYKRDMEVAMAHNTIQAAVTDAIRKHPNLTHAELTSVLGSILLEWNRYAIRDERERYCPYCEAATI